MTEPANALSAPALASSGSPEARLDAPPCPACGGDDVHEGTGFPGEEDHYICDSCEAAFRVDEEGRAVLVA